MTVLRSKKYFLQAQQVLAGGAGLHGPAGRALAFMVSRAEGASLYDLEGRAYTDYYLDGGAHILGHANRNVVLSAKKHAERGLSFGFSGSAEVDLAVHIIKKVPSMEKVQFVHSGQEAVSRAADLAFSATGRGRVIRFRTGGEGKVQQGGVRDDRDMVLPYNDTGAFEQALKEGPKDFAGVIVSPVMVGQGIVLVQKEFLDSVYRLTRAYGVVLIFDETQSGFRTFPGCAHAALEICPDLTCLGSVIGGGFALGLYGGRADLMAREPAPRCGQGESGFISPVILRAGLMALRLLTDDFYRALNDKARMFREKMNTFFQQSQISVGIDQYGSMMCLSVLNGNNLRGTAGSLMRRQCVEYLWSRGIVFPAGETEPFFISGQHRRRDLDILQHELEAFFCDMRDKGGA